MSHVEYSGHDLELPMDRNEPEREESPVQEHQISDTPDERFRMNFGVEFGLEQGPQSSRSMDSAWDENRTETTAADALEQQLQHHQLQQIDEQQNGSEYWDCCSSQLPPIEADDLTKPGRSGPDRLAQTNSGRPRRVAACHSIDGQYGGLLGRASGFSGSKEAASLLARQDSGTPPLSAILLVKYYEVHDRLGIFDGHEGAHIGELRLSLEHGSQFADLCVSNRHQTVYLADQANSRVYAVDLSGQLRCTIAKRLSGPQAICVDDWRSLLFVCQRRKVRIFRQVDDQRHQYLRSLKSPEFRNLSSASARDGRLWLADSQADLVHVFAVRDTELDPLHAIALRNPLCISLDASGSAFVTSGEPLHRVSVYGPDGCEIGSFGGWGAKPSKMKLPTGICAYQLSHLVDKRMVVLCCFAEHNFRMYSLKNLDTSII